MNKLKPMNLFVYGTLMDQDIMKQVSGNDFSFRSAVLKGYMRRVMRDEVYPGIAPCTNEQVDGVLYLDVTAAAIARLDRFEGAQYQRRPVCITGPDGHQYDADAYVVARTHRHRLSNALWHFDAFVKSHKSRFQSGYAGYRALEDG